MFEFEYALLSKSKSGWYIGWYQTNPITEEKERFRKRFDLNRIKDPKQREKRAREIITDINRKLPDGWPFDNLPSKSSISLKDGIEVARDAKMTSDRYKTRTTYKSQANIFLKYLKESDYLHKPADKFDQVNAIDFLDWALRERGIGARTYNNYILFMRSLFSELKDRKYVKANPFSNLKKKKETSKMRRLLTDHEQKSIITEVKDTDRQLLLAILLVYYTFIRPVELRRLRVHHINLGSGVIQLPGKITKNKENSVLTIPDVFMGPLRSYNLDKLPPNDYLFGPSMEPGKRKCGHHTISRRHNRVVKKLIDDEIMADSEGVYLYSWKDTGVFELHEAGVPIMEIKKQCRHKDLSTTQRYLNELKEVNENIKRKAKRLL